MTTDEKQQDKSSIPAPVAGFFTDESLEILQHFGLDAPHLLNHYANVIEDALIEQCQVMQILHKRIQELKAELSCFIAMGGN